MNYTIIYWTIGLVTFLFLELLWLHRFITKDLPTPVKWIYSLGLTVMAMLLGMVWPLTSLAIALTYHGARKASRS